MQVNINRNICSSLAGITSLKRYFNSGIDNSRDFCFKSKLGRQTLTADLRIVHRFNSLRFGDSFVHSGSAIRETQTVTIKKNIFHLMAFY
jgi:hypothetical protein